MFETLARSLRQKNPFYLLSAGSMLVGCFALSHALELRPGNWKSLAVLIGVLQLYELVLVALAAFLLRRRKLFSDARTLFFLEALFLLDATFLNAEIAAAEPWASPWVATGSFVLAAVKLVAIREALGLGSRRRLAASLVQIAVMLYAPVVVAVASAVDTKLAAFGLGREWLPLAAYALWWAVGLLPLLHAWALDAPSKDAGPVGRSVESVLLVAPFVSALLHLVSLQWMYGAAWHAGFFAPLVLGGGTALAHYGVRRSRSGLWPALRWGAPGIALLLSTGAPDAVVFALYESASSTVEVTPFRLALFVMSAVFLLQRFLADDPRFAWAALLSLTGCFSGSSFGGIGRAWSGVLPETAAELGMAAVVAAFAFLAFGAALSLWRPAEASDEARPPFGN